MAASVIFKCKPFFLLFGFGFGFGYQANDIGVPN